MAQLDTDPAARSAAMWYASSVGAENPQLYEDIKNLVLKLEEADEKSNP